MKNEINTLRAWIEGDYTPTLFIQGEITTKGEKPVVQLSEAVPQGINPKILLLKQTPDIYDPTGTVLLKVKDYSKKLQTDTQYTSVTIEGAKGNIELQVELKKKSQTSNV
jgi:hypothetical protein